MADFLAKVLGVITVVSTVICIIQVPVVLIFFIIIFGVIYVINPKL